MQREKSGTTECTCRASSYTAGIDRHKQHKPCRGAMQNTGPRKTPHVWQRWNCRSMRHETKPSERTLPYFHIFPQNAAMIQVWEASHAPVSAYLGPQRMQSRGATHETSWFGSHLILHTCSARRLACNDSGPVHLFFGLAASVSTSPCGAGSAIFV